MCFSVCVFYFYFYFFFCVCVFGKLMELWIKTKQNKIEKRVTSVKIDTPQKIQKYIYEKRKRKKRCSVGWKWD